MNDLEALDSLIGCYLNEDWPDEFGDPWTAVETFVRQEPDYAPFVHADVDLLLERSTSDEEVENRLDEFGLGYRPSTDGSISYRTWLLAVADRVDELLQKSPAA